MPDPDKYTDNVFINCPFDDNYNQLFEATIFAVHDCGFIARCAREEDDGGNVRVTKIMQIIDQCIYGIHDLSKADVDEETELARFNMPFELGLFMGAQYYPESEHYNKDKKSLILDSERFRYQKFISDISGQDIKSHNDSAHEIISCIRSFLMTNSKRNNIPSGRYIAGRFDKFIAGLPSFCETAIWDRENLTFIEYVMAVVEWIKLNPI